jgi:glucose-1-phosphate thymidylyltransferase
VTDLQGILLAHAPLLTDGFRGVGVSSMPALLPVANRPLGAYALETLRRADVRGVTITSNDDALPQLREALVPHAPSSMEIEFLVMPEDLGEALAVHAACERHRGQAIAVHAGDCLFRGDVAALAAKMEAEDLDGLLVREPSVSRGPPPSPTKRRARFDREGVISGVQFLGPGACETIIGASNGADDTLDDVARALAAGGKRVGAATVESGWRCGEEVESLLYANRLVLESLDHRNGHNSPTSDIQGPVHIHPDAFVESSVILGPAVIGAGARVVDAYVGPYTAIGAGAVVDNAEVEHSVVMDFAVIRNVGQRLESSIIGRGAQVQRSFAMPKTLSLMVGADARVSLV